MLLVSNPDMQARTVNSFVETAQVAPTILKILGLDPNALDAVRGKGRQSSQVCSALPTTTKRGLKDFDRMLPIAAAPFGAAAQGFIPDAFFLPCDLCAPPSVSSVLSLSLSHYFGSRTLSSTAVNVFSYSG